MEQVNAIEAVDASVIRGAGVGEQAEAHGRYLFQCFDKDGKLKWEDTIENVVTTVGKNLALDTFLSGSAYTAATFLGLISSVSYTAVAAADTMVSHAGWFEVSAVTYFPTVAARLAPTFAAAASGSKATSSAVAFSIITNGGTIKGCFLVFGTGAAATLGSTAGTLYSAGTFTGGDKVVSVSDTVNVTYTASLS